LAHKTIHTNTTQLNGLEYLAVGTQETPASVVMKYYDDQSKLLEKLAS